MIFLWHSRMHLQSQFCTGTLVVLLMLQPLLRLATFKEIFCAHNTPSFLLNNTTSWAKGSFDVMHVGLLQLLQPDFCCLDIEYIYRCTEVLKWFCNLESRLQQERGSNNRVISLGPLSTQCHCAQSTLCHAQWKVDYEGWQQHNPLSKCERYTVCILQSRTHSVFTNTKDISVLYPKSGLNVIRMNKYWHD